MKNSKDYYNEWDTFASKWLRKLFPDAEVDRRSIEYVEPEDLAGKRRCHFFGGIGGWELALQLAGWPEDQEVWTGSCPCQPFSVAGSGEAEADERHLWPELFRLVAECRPPVVFGEQVSNAVGHGWLDGVFADLEGQDYACGAVVLGAHSVGAPHPRQRLFWVAESSGFRSSWRGGVNRDQESQGGGWIGSAISGEAGGMANTDGGNSQDGHIQRGREQRQQSQDRGIGLRLGDTTGGRLGVNRSTSGSCGHADEPIQIDGLGDTIGQGLEIERDVRRVPSGASGASGADARQATFGTSASCSAWSDYRVITCGDGKRRRIPTEPSLFPLADGVPNRVGRLRGYGNAIVPQVAAAFIRAYMDTLKQ